MRTTLFDITNYKKFGYFKLSSDQTSNEFYDMKEAMGEPNNLEEIINEIASRIKIKPDVIIGLELGGIPIAVGLSLKLQIPFAMLRRRKHTHGMQKLIEGYQGKGRVLLVDDVKTSGRTIYDAEIFLMDQGYSIVQAETIITRSL